MNESAFDKYVLYPCEQAKMQKIRSVTLSRFIQIEFFHEMKNNDAWKRKQ